MYYRDYQSQILKSKNSIIISSLSILKRQIWCREITILICTTISMNRYTDLQITISSSLRKMLTAPQTKPIKKQSHKLKEEQKTKAYNSKWAKTSTKLNSKESRLNILGISLFLKLIRLYKLNNQMSIKPSWRSRTRQTKSKITRRASSPTCICRSSRLRTQLKTEYNRKESYSSILTSLWTSQPCRRRQALRMSRCSSMRYSLSHIPIKCWGHTLTWKSELGSSR